MIADRAPPQGLLQAAANAQVQAQRFDQDDYGNETLESDEGLVGGTTDDERRTTTTYALGGQALGGQLALLKPRGGSRKGVFGDRKSVV